MSASPATASSVVEVESKGDVKDPLVEPQNPGERKKTDGQGAQPAVQPGIMGLLPSVPLMVCIASIIGSLMVYGVLQEKIMTTPYGYDPATGFGGERFGNSFFLVLNNRLVAAFVAAGILLAKRDLGQLRNTAPLYKYFLVSMSNVAATSCQYEALKWVTFPTQTLFKCGKMVPVMIWSTIMGTKKYGILDYSVALMVAGGCTAFTVFGNVAAHKGATHSSIYGLLLMAGYLGFDGFTSTFQEKLFGSYEMSVYNQMLYVNCTSAVMSIFFSVVSGQVMTTVDFVTKYPRILTDATVLSVSAVTGQFAITYTIKNFGALTYATIMTLRQLLSVITSNILFAHHMTVIQWLSTLVVFGSLLFRSWYYKKG
eukprot:CAMPEP_0184692596 /NCGR_PEP_ID=MMETSP0313-20130426/1010_1 /TAXON_ID=2792 /ORGANISM="Porphyridium aerugineum, Strain SAG 1380-2" /LENGTH=368 /DNA_ID=CAMNT_0027150437 /DNA_START=175 /DNA_END=1281 /DNA_ORIENTATION=-